MAGEVKRFRMRRQAVLLAGVTFLLVFGGIMVRHRTPPAMLYSPMMT